MTDDTALLTHTAESTGALSILLVDDDEDDYVMTRDLLAEIPDRSIRLDWVSSYSEALKAIERDRHGVYLLDFRLGERTGLDLLRLGPGTARLPSFF